MSTFGAYRMIEMRNPSCSRKALKDCKGDASLSFGCRTLTRYLYQRYEATDQVWLFKIVLMLCKRSLFCFR
jgi:hypothetical protein